MSESKSDGFSDLARSNRRTRSAALMRAATELYILDRDHDIDQNRRFEELLVHLLPDAPLADRQFVADRLADSTDAPTAVLTMLARDEIDVARPVLERSRALGAFELLATIAATGEAHHEAIARRDDLPPQVRTALELSLGLPAADAGEEAADEEAADTPLQPAAARPVAIDRAIEPPRGPVRATSGPIGAWEYLNADRPSRLRRIAEIAAAPPVFDETALQPPGEALEKIVSTAQVIGFARGWQVDELIAAIAGTLRLPPEFVAASLNDQTGEPLAVLLKAMRLDIATAQQVFLLMSPVGRDVERFFPLADLYSAIDSYVADTLVAYWRGERPMQVGDSTEPAAAIHLPITSDAVGVRARENQAGAVAPGYEAERRRRTA